MRYKGTVCGVAFALALFPMTISHAAEIAATPETLAEILARIEPGDTVTCADGLYEGGFELRRSGKEGAPITVKAVGDNCVFEGGRDCLNVEGASHIIIEEIHFRKAERVGLRVAAPSDDPAAHVTVRRCVFADNTWPGIMTGHINNLTIEDCEAYGSVKSHGIYVGNSGDDPIVRNNRIHHNFGNGIHVNGDPECGGDGVISRALIENNVIWENGKRGGAAINMTHVQDSLIRNNLAYNNYGAGVTLYYDTGGDQCASKRNKVVNNTVYFRPGEGKFALLVRKRATDCTIMNNILIGGRYGAVHIEENCYPGLEMDHNVIHTYAGQVLFGDSSENVEVTAADRSALGFDVHSVVGKMPHFVDTEGGDLRLKAGSVGVDGGADLGGTVATDIDGVTRPQGTAFDCGCYESTPQ